MLRFLILLCMACCAFAMEELNGENWQSLWSLSEGKEFPGAVGSLSSDKGNVLLQGSFAGGGHYVSAVLRLPSARHLRAIEANVRMRGAMSLNLRVMDSTGQVLVYYPWCGPGNKGYERCSFSLESPPAAWWGGIGNGKLNGGIGFLEFVLDKDLYKGEKGSLEISSVGLHGEMPVEDLDMSLTKQELPGVQNNRFGVSVHDLGNRAALDSIAAIGMRTVRTDLYWHLVETKPAAYDWNFYDGFAEALKTRNLKAHFILNYNNPLYSYDQDIYKGISEPLARQAFSSYCAAAARHFGSSVEIFEVWNEPNLAHFWKPNPQPLHFAQLFQQCTDSIRATGTRALVIPGGIFAWSYPFIDRRSMPEAWTKAAGLSLHPYRREAPESFYLDALALAADWGNVSPYISEWGYSSTDFSAQGDGHDSHAREMSGAYMLRIWVSCMEMNAGTCVLYDISDDGIKADDKEQNFGLLDTKLGTKPGWTYISTLSRLMRSHKLHRVYTQNPLLRVYALENKQSGVYMMWSLQGGQKVKLGGKEETVGVLPVFLRKGFAKK